MEKANMNDVVPASIPESESTFARPIIPPPNPEGVRRAAGVFRDNPMLGELIKVIKEHREQERRLRDEENDAEG
jgi:hypothetical protein